MLDSNQREGEINKQTNKKFSIRAIGKTSRDNSENIFNFQQFELSRDFNFLQVKLSKALLVSLKKILMLFGKNR